MQNFGESSVNFEVFGIGGLNKRFLLSSKLDVHFTQPSGQSSAFSGHTYSILVENIRVLKTSVPTSVLNCLKKGD